MLFLTLLTISCTFRFYFSLISIPTPCVFRGHTNICKTNKRLYDDVDFQVFSSSSCQIALEAKENVRLLINAYC